MTSLYSFMRIIKSMLTDYRKKAVTETYFIGDFSGNVYPDSSNLNIIYVHNKTSVREVYNQRVPNVPGLRVKIGIDPDSEQPNLLQVIDQEVQAFQNPDYPNIPPGISKLLSYGGMESLFIYGEQYLPGLVTGNNGFVVTIYPFLYMKSTGESAGLLSKTTIDLSSYQPASGAIAVGIFIEDDGTLAVVNGSTQSTPELITPADFPAAPDATYHHICAVRLFSGQTSILQNEKYTDIFLQRWFSGGGSSGGSAGGDLSGAYPNPVVATSHWDNQSVSAAATLADGSAPVVLVDTTAASFILKLPAVPSIKSWFWIVDDKGQWAINNLTLDPNGKTINGSISTITLNTAYAVVGVYYDGTGWFITHRWMSNTTPSMDGTASVGTSHSAARADHIHPTDNGLISLQRLFGTNVPGATYSYTKRTFKTNNFAGNIAGFEDNQASPYPFSAPFSLSYPASGNYMANSANKRHWLAMRNWDASSHLYLEWTSSTAKNYLKMISIFSANPSALDYCVAEIRFWDVQSPTGTSPYWAMRFNWLGVSQPSYPFVYALYYGTGITISVNDGTRVGINSPIVPGLPYYIDAQVVSTSTIFANISIAEGDYAATPSTAQAGQPSNFKTMRLYIPAPAYYQFAFLDDIIIS